MSVSVTLNDLERRDATGHNLADLCNFARIVTKFGTVIQVRKDVLCVYTSGEVAAFNTTVFSILLLYLHAKFDGNLWSFTAKNDLLLWTRCPSTSFHLHITTAKMCCTLLMTQTKTYKELTGRTPTQFIKFRRQLFGLSCWQTNKQTRQKNVTFLGR